MEDDPATDTNTSCHIDLYSKHGLLSEVSDQTITTNIQTRGLKNRNNVLLIIYIIIYLAFRGTGFY